ncbi:putative phospholipid/glycerol acyltransferase [Actinoplanes missouriensis 431]|uniref:Putative phospholipid/glycerol acyltransferase n=1 Tax=Actinoplanes missouriensis (strain ATCC 14538 / DSM 43046 / CBS 188.64 / JCM 3121 / NBRC 102363 / NCIMB 12654 / NRRL B-3342 / UNCC 431) TaxID=512565 RepID=I0HHS8_ACTM4|nr:lysophospholipid acyltransferase family protein [Actinoplanes missouriensis]BAL92565.1 putative phospholipid/glycerol acyltransferase [Actinoplanes missouriensis 431]
MELVYPPVVGLAKTLFRVLDLKIEVEGGEHIPSSGGAVLASNHSSYLDFIFCGLGAQPSKRLVRFMAKKSVFDHKVSGPLMRGMKHIPVDRKAGTAAFREATEALRNGEIVGVFPEATISESFTVKGLKSGAARMAQEAGVPLIPMAVWGPHRLWTKGRKKELTKRHVPVLIKIGEALHVPEGATPEAVTALLKERLTGLLDAVQKAYPEKPAGDDDRWWLPAHLGGTAPLPPARQASDASGV